MAKTLIMAVLNVTPDSFSDGGHYLHADKAIARGLRLVEEGADIIDVGPESTSYYTDPTKKPVSTDEQIRRAIPVIAGLAQRGITTISIDTSNAAVAKAALDHGAVWINDQQAGAADPDMPEVMTKAQRVVLMHGFGMGFGVEAGEKTRYAHVISELANFFTVRSAALMEKGLSPDKIIIDPGFGFGKGLEDSLIILGNLAQLKALGFPLLVGLSRKSFIGKLTEIEAPEERDNASLGGNILSLLSGVDVIRTHNVAMLAQARCLVDAALARRQQ